RVNCWDESRKLIAWNVSYAGAKPTINDVISNGGVAVRAWCGPRNIETTFCSGNSNIGGSQAPCMW
ncbi:MAG: hypothetical protein EBR26_03550, partial [Microbacteriaceae bacterium]|nr:hypothetical protein [Microbacteriaceae bacterium]